MSAGPRYRLRDGLLAQTALPEAIVLDTVSGEYFELNAVASTVLAALVGGESESAAIARVVDAFDTDAAQASADCAAFIATLRARGWLVVDDAAR
jgi:hypothetical protein